MLLPPRDRTPEPSLVRPVAVTPFPIAPPRVRVLALTVIERVVPLPPRVTAAVPRFSDWVPVKVKSALRATTLLTEMRAPAEVLLRTPPLMKREPLLLLPTAPTLLRFSVPALRMRSPKLLLPERVSAPAFTVMAPVLVLLPVRIRVPAPPFVRPVAVRPSVIVPLRVRFPALTMTERAVPVPPRAMMVFPMARSRVPVKAKSPLRTSCLAPVVMAPAEVLSSVPPAMTRDPEALPRAPALLMLAVPPFRNR